MCKSRKGRSVLSLLLLSDKLNSEWIRTGVVELSIGLCDWCVGGVVGWVAENIGNGDAVEDVGRAGEDLVLIVVVVGESSAHAAFCCSSSTVESVDGPAAIVAWDLVRAEVTANLGLARFWLDASGSE